MKQNKPAKAQASLPAERPEQAEQLYREQNSTGMLGFYLKSLIVALLLPTPLAIASVAVAIPLVTVLISVVLWPSICAVLFMVFSGRVNASPSAIRLSVGLFSLIASLLYLLFTAGTLYVLFSNEPVAAHYLQDSLILDFSDFAESMLDIGSVYVASLLYVTRIPTLFSDLAAWNIAGFLTIAVSSCILQIVLPQTFIQARHHKG